MIPFSGHSEPTLGVEQEFHLIDPETAALTPQCDKVMEALESPYRELCCQELFYSVLEMRSPICHSAGELEKTAIDIRRALSAACKHAGVLPVAGGTHPFSRWQDQIGIDNKHYQWVLDQHVFLTRRLLSFGLHIHVALKSAESVFYVQNEMCRWIYPLLALSANSPFYEGYNTGLASMRAHLFHSVPRTGLPPAVKSMEELDQLVNKFIESGDIHAPGDMWWSMRIQPPLGTLEFRLLDMPISVSRLAVLAAIIQAACVHYQNQFFADVPASIFNESYLQENHWKAMRFGKEATIIEPETGEVFTISDQLQRLLDLITPTSRQLGGRHYLEKAYTLLNQPTESEWQVSQVSSSGLTLKELELLLAEKGFN